jgi:hypothetical protein
MSDYYPSIDTAWRNSPLGRMAYAAPARARRTDPVTSHEAAAAVADFEGDHYVQILEALAVGPAGATAIAARCGLGRDAVGKRMSELARRGLVFIDGTERNANGRNEARYRRVTNGG